MSTPVAHDGARSASADRASRAAQAGGDGAAVAGNGEPPLLRLQGINKSFGQVHALIDVNLDITAGEVTALIGDNGAGKSTLIKSVSGISEPDSGQIIWKGRQVAIKNPKDATGLGIATVYQDLALCDNLDIVDNMYLGRELRRHLLLDESAMEVGARQSLADLSVVTVHSVRQLVGSLSGGQRQAVAVAKAVMWSAELVILDEPTAALGVSQTALVLDLIKRLASRGVAVLVVSHNLNDVFAVADRIAVLYLGQLAATVRASDIDTQIAVQYITTGTADGAAPSAGSGAGSGERTER